ncbi:hypothetical protein SLS63_011303 [Diaporthe eres]|uniref:Integral membrane protein n=1 Tax=Diaporthe eres TaxID=83184 RepID=A0ABR1NUK4_DIAER
MSTGNATLDAVGAASGAATVELAVEWIAYLVIIIVITALRTYARASIPGRSGFGWDDYLVWIAVVWYVILTAEVYVIGVTAVGIANDSMTNEYRARLANDGPGSQEFGLRVLGSKVQLAAWISYSLVLWLLKGSLLCFFVVRLTNSNSNGDGAWALRECFVGMVTTNLAPIIPLFRKWLSPWLGRLESSSDGNTNHTGVASSRTMKSRNRDPRSPGLKLKTPGRHHSSDSSEHIIDVEMQSYNSPNKRNASSDPIVGGKQAGKSSGGNGNDSPTLIIQRNGEMQASAESANEATFYRIGDIRDRDWSIR